MPIEDIMVHVAVPLEETETGPRVDGEAESGDVPQAAFPCCLFLPQGTEDENAGTRGRRVRAPTLLYEPTRADGTAVSLDGTEKLLVTAPELNLAEGSPENAAVLYRVTGRPQPAGRPGDPVIVVQATLKRVED